MRLKRGIAFAALAAAITAGATVARAETVRFGVAKINNCAPVAIALAKGYFKEEGIEPQFSYFEAQAPVAVAVASGQPAETAVLGLPYVDREGRTDGPGMQSQIDWYRSIGAIKTDFRVSAVVDQRYASERPAQAAATK